jgi:hypothetical protein
MNKMKCMIKDCENNALISFNDRWICGSCLLKIRKIQKEKMDRIMEEMYD